MKAYFIDCGYPPSMISSVLSDVEKKPRNIEYTSNKGTDSKCVSPWISTFGQGSKELKEFTFKANKALLVTPSFQNSDKKPIQAAFRKASSIKQVTSKPKLIGSSHTSGAPTVRCKKLGEKHVGRKCDVSHMIFFLLSGTPTIKHLTLKFKFNLIFKIFPCGTYCWVKFFTTLHT